MIYDLWFTLYDLRSMVYDLRFTLYDHTIYGLRSMVYTIFTIYGPVNALWLTLYDYMI